MYLVALVALVAIAAVIVVVYLTGPKGTLEPLSSVSPPIEDPKPHRLDGEKPPAVSSTPADPISVPQEVKQETPQVAVTPPQQSLGQAVSFQINYVYRKQGEQDVERLEHGSVLESGDRYKLFFTPEQKSYVYIFQLDSSGQFYKLFPMTDPEGVRDRNVNPVDKGRRYILPGAERSYQLDRQKGKERIYFIASRERSAVLENLYDDLEVARKSGDSTQGQNASDALNRHLNVRGIAGVVEDEHTPVSWESKGNVFEIMGRRLDQACEDCAYVVEFEHR